MYVISLVNWYTHNFYKSLFVIIFTVLQASSSVVTVTVTPSVTVVGEPNSNGIIVALSVVLIGTCDSTCTS